MRYVVPKFSLNTFATWVKLRLKQMSEKRANYSFSVILCCFVLVGEQRKQASVEEQDICQLQWWDFFWCFI